MVTAVRAPSVVLIAVVVVQAIAAPPARFVVFRLAGGALGVLGGAGAVGVVREVAGTGAASAAVDHGGHFVGGR